MRNPPDLFELRLDGFANWLAELRAATPRLRVPLIITARHPAEGGTNNLRAAQRRALLVEFLPRAQFVDVELRSADSFLPILHSARRNRVQTIISFHDFNRPPAASQLEKVVTAACSLGADVVKIAVRTDTPAQLETLLGFFEAHRRRIKLVTMGIGKLGRRSRAELARRGCLVNYGHLGAPAAPGQLSLGELRRVLSGR